METGFACPAAGESCHAVVCGDSLQDSYVNDVEYGVPGEGVSYRSWGYEECDDGNAEAGDGCSDGCTIEGGYACGMVGEPCHVVACGDGIQDTIRTEYDCADWESGMMPGEGSMAQAPPEVVASGEMLDSGSEPTMAGTVTVPADMPMGTPSACYYYDWEACDDGNTESGDGCDASCHVEDLWICDNAGEHLSAGGVW
jgi:cysteine-rich repeat protein